MQICPILQKKLAFYVANYNFTKDMLNLVSENLSFITHIKIKKNFFQSYDVNPGVKRR